jgi:hypothetical protein
MKAPAMSVKESLRTKERNERTNNLHIGTIKTFKPSRSSLTFIDANLHDISQLYWRQLSIGNPHSM